MRGPPGEPGVNGRPGEVGRKGITIKGEPGNDGRLFLWETRTPRTIKFKISMLFALIQEPQEHLDIQDYQDLLEYQALQAAKVKLALPLLGHRVSMVFLAETAMTVYLEREETPV